jgi:hypothetical protein
MTQDGDDQILLDLAQHLKVIDDALGSKLLPQVELTNVIRFFELQKSLMIEVATGGSRIQEKNEEYKSRRIMILSELHALDLLDPNSYADLWSWYGKWSDGSLPTYQSRRDYVTNLYQPILDNLLLMVQRREVVQVIEPTGWARVD